MNNRERKVVVYLSEENYQKIEQAAKEEHLPVSTYARSVVLKQIDERSKNESGVSTEQCQT